jgi:hypothetical protein
MKISWNRNLTLTCSWSILCLVLYGACVKRREISIRNTQNSAATSGAKTAVFEMRSTILASISPSESAQFINQIVESQSNQVFRDSASKPPKPSKVLGGEMTTTVGSTTTKLCLKGGRLKVGAESSMSVRLELDVCGFDVVIDQPKARIEFSGALASKPLNISMRELRLSNSNILKTIALTFDVGVSSQGGLFILGRPKTEGIVELLAPGKAKFDVELSETSWIESRLNKTREDVVSDMLEGIVAASEGFVTSALQEAIARSLLKAQDAFARKSQTLDSRLFEVKFLGYKLGLSTDLLGFFGGESLGVAVQANIQASKRFLSMPGYQCQVDEIGQMPSPIVGSLHASELVTGPVSQDVAKSLPGVGILQGRIFVPYETIDFSLWKIFGQSGHCIWKPEAQGGVEGEVRFGYDNGIRVRVVDRSEFAVELVSHLPEQAQILSIQFPAVEFRLPGTLAKRIESESKGAIKTDNLIDSKLGLVLVKLKKFRYAIAVAPKSGPRGPGIEFLKLSRGPKKGFNQSKKLGYEDIWKAITDEILQRSEPEGESMSDSIEKNAIAVSRVISDMIDQQVFQLLAQAPIEFSEAGNTDDFSIQDVKLVKEGILANWQLKQKVVGLTGLENSSSRSIEQTELGLSGPNTSETSVKLVFEKLGIPIFIGEDFASVDFENKNDTPFHEGLKCKGSTPIRVDSGVRARSDVRFLNCNSNTHSIEYRIQTLRTPQDKFQTPFNPILYQRILIDRHKDQLPTFERRELLATDLLSALGLPESRIMGDGFFRLTWRRGATQLSAVTLAREFLSANMPKSQELQLMRSFVQSIEIWNVDSKDE